MISRHVEAPMISKFVEAPLISIAEASLINSPTRNFEGFYSSFLLERSLPLRKEVHKQRYYWLISKRWIRYGLKSPQLLG